MPQTIRQQIISLLNRQELDVRDLSQELGIQEKEVYLHLDHVARSVKRNKKKLAVRPAECLQCGYIFKDRSRYTCPGRCPRCRQSHLRSPFYRIE